MFVLGGAPLLFGCANAVYYTQLQPAPRVLKPHAPEDLEILAVTPPSRPHRDIGLFQVVQSDADNQDAMTTLRARAAAKGCDAITITSIDHRKNRYQSPNIQASCVVYEQPATAEPEPIPAPLPPTPDVPPSSRPASVGASPGEVRTAPFRVAPLVLRLDPGQRVRVSIDGTNGWRAVILPDGRAGYIEDRAIRLE
jgi:hypothetical protein